VRKFYEAIKAATADGIVDLFFGTGVTPITLDSMTSGFNIAKNYSVKYELNEMLGFTKHEVKELIELSYIAEAHDILTEIKKLYNGYLFEEDGERVYNSDMVLYYLTEYQSKNKPPKELVDPNIASDYGKIKRLFALQDPFRNSEVLEELIEYNETAASLTIQFSFERDFERDDFISLLFYLGLISINRDDFDFLVFSIPNYVIKTLYRAYFIDFIKSEQKLDFKVSDAKRAIKALSQNKLQPFLNLVENTLKTLSNQDYKKLNEKHVKAIFVAFASLSNLYFIKSEPEIENKYPDIMFLYRPPFFPNFQFIFELKYYSKVGAKGLETKKQKAINQLKEYLQFEEIKNLKNLKAYVLIFVGSEIKVMEEVK